MLKVDLHTAAFDFALAGEPFSILVSQKVLLFLRELGEIFHPFGHFDDTGAADPFCACKGHSCLFASFLDRGAVGELFFFACGITDEFCHGLEFIKEKDKKKGREKRRAQRSNGQTTDFYGQGPPRKEL
jgi:hypothetical protein